MHIGNKIVLYHDEMLYINKQSYTSRCQRPTLLVCVVLKLSLLHPSRFTDHLNILGQSMFPYQPKDTIPGTNTKRKKQFNKQCLQQCTS